MAVNLSPVWGAGAQLFDNSGNVLTGGKIYTYLAGTTTPATTYTSSNGLTPNSNPIIANSAGRVPYEIWLTENVEYKFVLKDSNDTLIGTYDNIVGVNQSQAVDAADVTYTPPFTGSVETNVEAKLAQTVSVEDFGAVGDGITDDTNAFIQACDLGIKVYANSPAYKITGEVPLVTGTSLEFTQNPTITLINNGENGRGFWVDDGVTDVEILGSATINMNCTTPGSDGTKNGAFTLSGDFYRTTDASGIFNVRIVGNFNVNSIGVGNAKAVQIYGYVENVVVDGVVATGQSNYALVCHWVGNGQVGVLPTKTWHPHNIKFVNCKAYDSATGSMARAFTTSAVGHVVFDNCVIVNPTTLGFNLFVGDYGYTYAQNLTDGNAFDVSIINCTYEGTVCALSVDGISSRLNGSPQWAGCDVGKNATVSVQGYLATIKSGVTATIDIAVSGIANFNADNLRVVEKVDTNIRNFMYLTSIRNANVNGEVVAQLGSLIRDCGNVEYNMDFSQVTETPNAGYGVGSSALSESLTTTTTVNAGDTTMGISAPTKVAGPGGYISYTTGGVTYEMGIETLTYTGSAQTITITPALVNIPSGSTVTLIQTVKNLSVGGVTIQGTEYGANFSGDSTAKVRNVSFFGTRFFRTGYTDINADAVDGLVVVGTSHEQAGQLTSSTANTNILISADTENYRISNCYFGKNNRVRYNVDLSGNYGVVEGNVFMSYNTSATNPAAIFKATAATGIQLNNNVVLPSLDLIYPATPESYTIASGAITVQGHQYTTFMAVDTEGSAASDDLDTINGGYEGQLIVFATSSDARDVTFKDATGNLILAGDFVCNNNDDTIMLVKRGNNWFEVSRSDNV